MKCDLHLHTTASDGRLSPAAIVRLAAAQQLRIIAITDHDTVAGVEEALQAGRDNAGMTVIPGVEINTDLASGELHILGYFVDQKNLHFIDRLQRIQASRVGRARQMVDKLAQLGLVISWERVQELAHGESICRPHIAQALMEKAYIDSEKEAFDKYIGRDGPAYVEREKVKPEDAVRIVLEAGGVPVLAHPADIKDIDALILKLKAAGLLGLEAYYGQYDLDRVRSLVKLARRYNLITTGGTDYHHFQDQREIMLGSVDIPAECIASLFQAAGRDLPLI